MPYNPVIGPEDAALLARFSLGPYKHVLIGTVDGTRYIMGVPRSQRQARTIMRQNTDLLLLLYQFGSSGLWYRVDF